jgi:hypothetical protein
MHFPNGAGHSVAGAQRRSHMLTRTTTDETRTSMTERCHRCGGLMVKEKFTVDFAALDFEGWRCVVCGEIIDPLIMANRKAHRAKVLPAPRLRTLKPVR